MNITDFTRDDFSFPGNHRAIVEDNYDPLDLGRVRVRIFGIHSLDPEETPIDHLPWAEPCLSMYYSGGNNITNKEQGDKGRYLPKKDIRNTNIPKRNTTSYDAEFVDNTMSNEGTGGIYTVPRKGSQVWCFFEGGDHTRIHYWSLAPKARDWKKQKNHLIEEIQEKRDDINQLRDFFNPDNEHHKGKTCSSNANVKVWTNKPKLEVFQIDSIKNYYITSYTSDLGVTSIIVNEPGKERMYLLHKGYMEHIDENGQRKILVGTSKDVTQSFLQGDTQVQSSIRNDKEEMIANNYELHIIGDFDIFVNSSTYIQCEKDVQINAKKNIGIVSREADIDIVCDKADFNLNTKGKTNIHSDNDLQINTDKNMIVKVGEDLNFIVKGKMEFKVEKEIIFDTKDTYNITSPFGFHVDAGGKFKVDPGGFGANVPMNAPVSNARHSGCFPGPGAGPATPYPGQPKIFAEKPFISGTTKKEQREQDPAVRQRGVDGIIDDLGPIREDTQVATPPEITTPITQPLEIDEVDTVDDLVIEETVEIVSFDDRLDDQLQLVDDEIDEINEEIAELEQREAEEIAKLEESEAELVQDSIDSEAKLSIDSVETLEEQNLDTQQEVKNQATVCRQNRDATCTEKNSQLGYVMTSNRLENKAQTQSWSNEKKISASTNVQNFNRRVANGSRGINRNINNRIGKLQAFKNRARINRSVNIRAKSSFSRRILNNPTTRNSLNLIDSTLSVLPNAANSILSVSRTLNNASNRLVGVAQMSNMVNLNGNANPDSYLELGSLSNSGTQRKDTLLRSLQQITNLPSNIQNDFKNIIQNLSRIDEVFTNSLRDAFNLSLGLNFNNAFNFINNQNSTSRLWESTVTTLNANNLDDLDVLVTGNDDPSIYTTIEEMNEIVEEMDRQAQRIGELVKVEESVQEMIKEIEILIDEAVVDISDGDDDSFLTLSFNNLEPNKLGLENLNDSIFTNPGRLIDVLENALTEVKTSIMITDSIKNGITNKTAGNKILISPLYFLGNFEDLYEFLRDFYLLIGQIIEQLYGGFVGSVEDFINSVIDEVLFISDFNNLDEETIYWTVVKEIDILRDMISIINKDASIDTFSLLSKDSYFNIISLLIFSLIEDIHISDISINFNLETKVVIIDRSGSERHVIINDTNMGVYSTDTQIVTEGGDGTKSGQKTWIIPDISPSLP